MSHVSVPTESSLRGQVAVVTGASGGIGRAIAWELARAGADLVVQGRHRERLAETARGIEACGGRVCTIRADLTLGEQRSVLVESALDWRGHVDIWINNAGADVLTGEAARLSFAEKLDVLWNTDVLATVDLCRAIGPRMQERGGVILNMGWDQAWLGMAGDAGEMFATIKGAVMAFTLSFAKSMAPRVRVNGLAPGWIKTAWGEEASDYWQSRAVHESLRQRWGTPDDVAQAARFLVSPAADFITGQILPVNGGWAGQAAERRVDGTIDVGNVS